MTTEFSIKIEHGGYYSRLIQYTTAFHLFQSKTDIEFCLNPGIEDYETFWGLNFSSRVLRGMLDNKTYSEQKLLWL